MKKFKKYSRLYIESLKLVISCARSKAILILILTPLMAAAPLLSTLVLEKMIDLFSNDYNEKLLILCIIVWILAFAVQSIISPITKYIQGLLTDTLVKEMSISLMKKSEELQSISFFEDASFNNDISFIKDQISWRPVNIIVFTFSMIESFIIIISMDLLIFSINWSAAILTLIMFIPQCYFTYQVQKEAFETTVINTEDNRELSYDNQVLMSKEYAKEARLYHTFPYFLSKYTKGFDVKFNRIQKVKGRKTVYATVFSLLNVLVCLWIFCSVIMDVKNGYLNTGAIVVYGSALIYIAQAMGRFVEDSSLYMDTLDYMQKYFNFLNQKDTLDRSGKDMLENRIETIEFRNVHFKYQSQQDEALRGISFIIHANEKTAVVGENGSGKTTLVKLLCRFYDPDSGMILVNGKDIKTYDLQSYREHFGAIFQDFCKYQLSMKENVMLSALDHLNEDAVYEEAVKKAGIESIRPDELLGTEFEEAHDLSGGQWQKVALARSFASNSDVIIMDEPTSALDPKSEYDLYMKFLEGTIDQTVIFITHRLAAVKFSDSVLVVKDGMIDACGKHSELMKSSEYYHDLYQMQSSYYQTESVNSND